MERFWDFQLRREKKLLPLFLNQSFRAMAVSLLSIFSGIYIYKTLFSLTGQAKIALLSVYFFFLVLYIFKFISNLFAEELARLLGLKRQIYFGLSFFAICLLIFSLSLKWSFLLFLASPFLGLSMGFYWFGQLGLMVKMGKEGAFGKEIGLAGALTTVFLLGIPLLGGILVDWNGYQALFTAALFFIFLAGLVVGRVKEEKTHTDTDLVEVIKLFKTHKRMFLAYAGNSAAATIYATVFPLYLFLILKKELSLGEFFSLSMVLVALINLAIGRLVDMKGKGAMIGYGSIFIFLAWLGRGLTRSVGLLFLFDITDRIAGGMVGIPLGVWSYQKAIDGHSTGRAMLFRELAVSLGSMVACLGLMVLVVLGLELNSVFWAAAILSLFPLLLIGIGRQESFWQKILFWRK